ncbi:hypothetical protein E0H82_02635 [Acinetobacter sp. ANC 4910]|uniref:hypothetical protein n=1 Tax=Acinetobacter sp. ANC 4910 TaxID=2529850 RepID=UPI00103EE6F4|nr:hypothetical protein [Acinetobacter sp. ANC 4910]TCB37519.1 hypothetical protein E0H82_02635 [Acinetobacter sp. ANC 4910]
MNNYTALDAVTKWIKESSAEDFIRNFNKLETEYGGITIGEYLEEYGILENEIEFHNIMTTEDFVFGLDVTTEKTNSFSDSGFKLSDETKIISIETQRVELIEMQYTNFFEAVNDSPYFDEAFAA